MSEANFVSPQSGLTFIEQLQILSTNWLCLKDDRPYLSGVSENTKKVVLTRPSCKMWNCPACAARNARRWIARVINHINRVGGLDWNFLTITAHEKMRGAASIKSLRQGWKKLYNRIRERFGVHDYVKVWERHADGSFHLHLLMCAKIKKRWLKDNARACGLGYQVDVRHVDNAGKVAGYISKYMVKSGLGEEFPKGLRRIEVSRGWTKLDDLKAENDFLWLVNTTREGQTAVAQRFYERGFDIVDMVKLDKV